MEAGVSQEELSQILTQLRSFVRPTSQTPAAPSQPQWIPAQFTPPPVPPSTYPPPTAPYPTATSAYPALPQVKAEALAPSLPVAPAAETSASVDQAQLNITNILSSLMKSGLVSALPADPAAAKAESTEQEPEEEAKPVVPTTEDLNAIKEAQADYRKRILAEKMEASLVENSM